MKTDAEKKAEQIVAALVKHGFMAFNNHLAIKLVSEIIEPPGTTGEIVLDAEARDGSKRNPFHQGRPEDYPG